MSSQESWFLESKLKDNSPWIIPITNEDFTIGRSDSCDLILNNARVSRLHSRIFFDMQQPYIQDMRSRNGTYVNGNQIKQDVRLQDRDIIRIGPINLVLRFGALEAADENGGTVIEDGLKSEQSFAEFYQISKREYDVLYLLLAGKSVKEIADKLFISHGTAKNHVLSIYKKTNCHTRIELATLYQEFTSKE